jgi:hypothetical protein
MSRRMPSLLSPLAFTKRQRQERRPWLLLLHAHPLLRRVCLLQRLGSLPCHQSPQILLWSWLILKLLLPLQIWYMSSSARLCLCFLTLCTSLGARACCICRGPSVLALLRAMKSVRGRFRGSRYICQLPCVFLMLILGAVRSLHPCQAGLSLDAQGWSQLRMSALLQQGAGV